MAMAEWLHSSLAACWLNVSMLAQCQIYGYVHVYDSTALRAV